MIDNYLRRQKDNLQFQLFICEAFLNLYEMITWSQSHKFHRNENYYRAWPSAREKFFITMAKESNQAFQNTISALSSQKVVLNWPVPPHESNALTFDEQLKASL